MAHIYVIHKVNSFAVDIQVDILIHLFYAHARVKAYFCAITAPFIMTSVATVNIVAHCRHVSSQRLVLCGGRTVLSWEMT